MARKALANWDKPLLLSLALIIAAGPSAGRLRARQMLTHKSALHAMDRLVTVTVPPARL
jgi:hypothetical protein